ncbi:MAG: hypothetical protein Q4P72_04055 [Eubacteriales bacterium]|nr:hypothetical protein [Eubacteriales bacterium]
MRSSGSGLIVPTSSLIFRDKSSRGTADIFILNAGYVHRETVKINLEDSDQAIIEAVDPSKTLLTQGAIVVANPASVREGQDLES